MVVIVPLVARVLVVVASIEAAVLVAVVPAAVLVEVVARPEQKFRYCANVGNIICEYRSSESESALLLMHFLQSPNSVVNESLSHSSGVFPIDCGICAASLQPL